MEEPTDTNYLTILIITTVSHAAESIHDFNWRLCQSAWATVVTNSFKKGTTLYRELLPLKHAPIIGNQIGPLVEACLSCTAMLEEHMGKDEMSHILMSQCQESESRAKAFIFLALSYYNAMVVSQRNPLGALLQDLMEKSYLQNATYYDQHGRLPDSGPPTNEETNHIARQVVQQAVSQQKKGCLIPFVALTMGMAATIAMIVCLVWSNLEHALRVAAQFVD